MCEDGVLVDVVIAGGSGQIALRLARLLAQHDTPARGLVRSERSSAAVRAAGARPVICDLEDLEHDVDAAIAGAEVVVFAAGSGPGSGPERKHTMDYLGALRLLWAARRIGVARYVMISAIQAAAPPAGESDYAVYLRAKAAADEALSRDVVPFTIVRPGWLTDDPGTGHIEVGPALDHEGRISRADVAAVLLAVIDAPQAAGCTFDVLAGSTPIAQAIAGLRPGW